MCRMTEKKTNGVHLEHFLRHVAAQDTRCKYSLLLQVSASRPLLSPLVVLDPPDLLSLQPPGGTLFWQPPCWRGRLIYGVGSSRAGGGVMGGVGGSHHFLTVWLSGCCYGFKPQSALTVSELQSCSQAEGLAIKRLRAVGVCVGWGGGGGGGNTSQSCPGAAAERRLPSVVWTGPVRVFGCV